MVLAIILGCSPPGPRAESTLDEETATAAPNDTGDDSASPDTADSGAADTADTAVADTADTGEPLATSKALCVVTAAADYGGDGTITNGHRWQLDTAGHELLTEYLNASLVAQYRHTYTYDADGHETLHVEDWEADGTPEVTHTSSYDSWGNLVSQTVDFLSSRYEYTWNYVYDSSGHVLSMHYDGYGDTTDGIVDETTASTYDATGNLLVETWDIGVDGTIERTLTHTYDAAGRLSTELWDYELADAWGTPYADRAYTYTYDESDRLLAWTDDEGADGNADIWTYTYDESGQPASLTTDWSGDGVIDRTYTWTYDAAGNVLTDAETHESGSVAHTYAYDADNHEVLRETYSSGELVFSLVSTFDTAGDLTEQAEVLASGYRDLVTTYTYDCGP